MFCWQAHVEFQCWQHGKRRSAPDTRARTCIETLACGVINGRVACHTQHRLTVTAPHYIHVTTPDDRRRLLGLYSVTPQIYCCRCTPLWIHHCMSSRVQVDFAFTTSIMYWSLVEFESISMRPSPYVLLSERIDQRAHAFTLFPTLK